MKIMEMKAEAKEVADRAGTGAVSVPENVKANICLSKQLLKNQRFQD